MEAGCTVVQVLRRGTVEGDKESKTLSINQPAMLWHTHTHKYVLVEPYHWDSVRAAVVEESAEVITPASEWSGESTAEWSALSLDLLKTSATISTLKYERACPGPIGRPTPIPEQLQRQRRER